MNLVKPSWYKGSSKRDQSQSGSFDRLKTAEKAAVKHVPKVRWTTAFSKVDSNYQSEN